MSNATQPFNVDAATLLYLNPELQAYSNIITVEDVRDQYSELSQLPHATPPLPGTYDDQVYLADNRDVLEFSSLNRTIYFAMSNEGIDVSDIEKNAMYLGTIMRDVYLVGNNTFEFKDIDELGAFRLNTRTLQVGDDVKLIRPKATDHVYGTVVALDPFSYRFTVRNPHYNVDYHPEVASNYTMYGIKLYDCERLARVNLTRKYVADPDNQEILTLSRDFNKEFHQILYPNTRLMTQSEAYVDFVNRWGLKDYRIANSGDMYNASAPLTAIMNLQVRCNITLGKLMRWNGFTICNLSSNDWSSNDDTTDNTILTERAIKSYVDRPYRTMASFNRVLASNDALFMKNVSMASNVYVRMDSTDMERNVNMRCNLGVDRNVTVSGYINCATTTQTMQLLAISRIGIGSDGASVVYDDYGYVPAPPPGGGNNGEDGGSNSTGGGGSNIGGGTGNNNTGGTGGVSISNISIAVSDKISFANDAYVMKATPFENTLRLFPSGADSASGYAMFDANGNFGVGLSSTTNALDYKLYVGGDVYATGVLITQSDERKKNDIRFLEGALKKVTQLRGCTYEIINKDNGNRRHIGLLAQDVLKICPEAVYTDDKGFHSIAYGNLIGLVIEAVKEIDKRLSRIETF